MPEVGKYNEWIKGGLVTTDVVHDYSRAKEAISDKLSAFMEVGSALLFVKESKAYVMDGFKSFAEFCDSYGISRAYGFYLARASEVVSDLKAEGVAVLPEKESHARLLSKIESKEDRAEVWSEVVRASDGKDVTFAAIDSAVKAFCDAKKEAEERPDGGEKLDPNGIPWPEAALADMTDVATLRGMTRDMKAITSGLAKMKKSGRPVAKLFNAEAFRLNARYVIEAIEEMEPYCVCPECRGKRCEFCYHRGWITKKQNERFIKKTETA